MDLAHSYGQLGWADSSTKGRPFRKRRNPCMSIREMMKKRSLWRRIPAKKIDRRFYGRTIRAYAHPTGALLIHHKPVSRNSQLYHLAGVWVVTWDGSMVRRRAYYGRRHKGTPPLRWANRALRDYHRGAGHFCDLIDGRRATVREAISSRPAEYEELPKSLFP